MNRPVSGGFSTSPETVNRFRLELEAISDRTCDDFFLLASAGSFFFAVKYSSLEYWTIFVRLIFNIR